MGKLQGLCAQMIRRHRCVCRQWHWQRCGRHTARVLSRCERHGPCYKQRHKKPAKLFIHELPCAAIVAARRRPDGPSVAHRLSCKPHMAELTARACRLCGNDDVLFNLVRYRIDIERLRRVAILHNPDMVAPIRLNGTVFRSRRSIVIPDQLHVWRNLSCTLHSRKHDIAIGQADCVVKLQNLCVIPQYCSIFSK